MSVNMHWISPVKGKLDLFEILTTLCGSQMTTVHNLEVEEVQAITKGIGVSYPACAATVSTALIIG